MNAELTSKCAYLFKTLKKAKIAIITYEFSGSGDDGQMEMSECKYTNSRYNLSFDWDSETIFKSSRGRLDLMNFEELLENVVDGILNYHRIDFMNNEGNEGFVTLNISEGKITTNYRVMAREESYLYI